MNNCISQAICASSTNDNIRERLRNTLEPRDITEHEPSYWSSIGLSDPSVTETLLYRLHSKICLVTEIHVQAFQDYFNEGFPIYSAKAIQFRLSWASDPTRHGIPYTSPVFPMSQVL
ncbi:unnamed protein product [Lathyrus oleraceus]